MDRVKLVPREITTEMLLAGGAQIPVKFPGPNDIRDAWRAMFDAAPVAAPEVAPLAQDDALVVASMRKWADKDRLVGPEVLLSAAARIEALSAEVERSTRWHLAALNSSMPGVQSTDDPELWGGRQASAIVAMIHRANAAETRIKELESAPLPDEVEALIGNAPRLGVPFSTTHYIQWAGQAAAMLRKLSPAVPPIQSATMPTKVTGGPSQEGTAGSVADPLPSAHVPAGFADTTIAAGPCEHQWVTQSIGETFCIKCRVTASAATLGAPLELAPSVGDAEQRTTQGETTGQMVAESVYLSAVQGRRDMRAALSAERDIRKRQEERADKAEARIRELEPDARRWSAFCELWHASEEVKVT